MLDWTIEVEVFSKKVEGLTPEEKTQFWWNEYKNGNLSKRAYEWLEMWND